MRVRRAVPDDAPGIVAVLAAVVAERVHSAIDRVWSVGQERQYLESLSAREVIHVALDDGDRIVVAALASPNAAACRGRS
jgi:hypothetical protein